MAHSRRFGVLLLLRHGEPPKGQAQALLSPPRLPSLRRPPLSLSTVLPAGLTGFFITWLASFKLLLFAFDRGPLSSSSWSSSASQYRRQSLFLFVLLTCFPVKLMQNQKQQRPSRETPKLPLNLPSKLLIFALSLPFHDYKHRVHPTLVLAFYCCMLYLFLEVVVGVGDLIVRPLLGVELDRPSDEPYLSTSLQDFWGRRWNLTVANALRHGIYMPTKSFLHPHVGVTSVGVAAVLAAFLVSGLMHERLIFST